MPKSKVNNNSFLDFFTASQVNTFATRKSSFAKSSYSMASLIGGILLVSTASSVDFSAASGATSTISGISKRG